MKNRKNDYIVFIISHGRPQNVITYETLKKYGYTGEIKIIIDNQDKTADEYYKIFGFDNVIMFDKLAIAKTLDIGDNFDGYRSTTYARNAAFDIAKQLGFTYFIVLDDDYKTFQFRFNDKLDYIPAAKRVNNLDRVFDVLVAFYRQVNIKSLCLAQGGDFMGGSEGRYARAVTLTRKCMNSWFCSTERRFQFFSRMNEDVNTYIYLSSIGNIFFTTNFVALDQLQTQAVAGGMTELYKQQGTYVKSFYSVIYMPSGAKIRMMQSTNSRIHHMIKANNVYPKIIREEHRKK